MNCLTYFHDLARLLRVALAGAMIVALAACAGSRGGHIPYDVQGFVAPDAPTMAPVAETYRVFPLDILTLKVFQVADLSTDYTVDLSGNLSMPLIGTVPAAGNTIEELQKKIETRLAEKYLKDPNVSIIVKESKRMTVAVDGSVQVPGNFPVSGPITLIKAVAMARGTSEFANPRRVAVFRQIDGKRMAAAFDLTSIRRGQEPDPVIYPGDTVVVDGSSVRQAQREILSNIPLLAIFSPVL